MEEDLLWVVLWEVEVVVDLGIGGTEELDDIWARCLGGIMVW